MKYSTNMHSVWAAINSVIFGVNFQGTLKAKWITGIFWRFSPREQMLYEWHPRHPLNHAIEGWARRFRIFTICVCWKDSIPHTSWTPKAFSVLKPYLHWQVCLDTFWSCLDIKDQKFHTFPFTLSRKVLFKEACVAGGFVWWARHSVAKRQKRRWERAPLSVSFSRRLCCSDALPTLT